MPRMRTYWKGHAILLFLVLYPVGLGAIDLSQCFSDVKSCANNSSNCLLNMSNTTAFSILRTSQGRKVTSADDATALSYTGCTQYCGAGPAKFSWTSFSQDYAAWLLPYLALVSQLPFGAQWRMDNLMSAVLTLGSPTLAAYSLYITLLNTIWVNDQVFAEIDYPDAMARDTRLSAVQVLSSLQQVPLRIHPVEFEFFVRLDKDEWWNTLAKKLDHSRSSWSIASATSISWVVIAYLLTVANSINHVPDNFESSGQATGSAWLWLLPVVVGWLVLSPKCDYTRVHEAYAKTNEATKVSTSGLTIKPWPGQSGRDIISPDELRIPPVFNYARIFSWRRNVSLASSFYRAARRKSSNHVGRDGRRIIGNVPTDVPSASRSGTHEQIIDGRKYTAANVLWHHGLFRDMIVASLMSLLLQWGTTSAAFLAVWFTPTTGLGCRSLAFLIYGALSTAVWMLLVLSSALGYYAHHPVPDFGILVVSPEQTCHPTRWLAMWVADLLRWIGKSLAIVNAIGLIANSVIQYAGVYSSCYCNSSVLLYGASAFSVIQPNSNDIELARNAWIGGVALSFSCCLFFLGSIYLVHDALPQ